MKIGFCCSTYMRPTALENAIACFQQFKLETCSAMMIILDDARQYTLGEVAPNVFMHGAAERFATLGAKRNACARLARARGCDVLAIMDDDDAYLPWTAQAIRQAISRAEVFMPGANFTEQRGELMITKAPYHAAWAYETGAFFHAGGYPEDKSLGEDKELRRRFELHGIKYSTFSSELPYFIQRWDTGYQHVCGTEGSDTAYAAMNKGRAPTQHTLSPKLAKPWLAMALEAVRKQYACA